MDWTHSIRSEIDEREDVTGAETGENRTSKSSRDAILENMVAQSDDPEKIHACIDSPIREVLQEGKPQIDAVWYPTGVPQIDFNPSRMSD